MIEPRKRKNNQCKISRDKHKFQGTTKGPSAWIPLTRLENADAIPNPNEPSEVKNE